MRSPAPYEVEQGAQIVQNEYIVYLRETASLESHFEWIGMDLSMTRPMFRTLRAVNAYRADLSDDLVHNLIRFDPGVSVVEPDIYVRPELGQRPQPAEGEQNRGHQNVRKWTRRPGFNMKWWNKMIVASQKVRFWPLYVGVHVPSTCGSHVDLPDE